MKLNYRKTFTVGLAFFSIVLTWSIYNSYVPIFLKNLLEGNPYRNTIAGAVLTMDNIAAITLIPFFGALSDGTWTRYGRRMPYLLLGMPLAGLLFAVVPGARFSLLPLVALLAVMNLAMAAFRAPSIALMPDITPSPLRSKANGVINLMGGLGGVLAYAVGSQLYKQGENLPFLVGGAILFVVPFVIYAFVKEEKGAVAEREEPEGIIETAKQVITEKEKSARFLLAAIFFWFIGWSGVEAFFTIYGTENWGMDPGTASFYLTYFSLPFMLFALPAGFMATAIGRRKTINIGLVAFGLVMGVMAFLTSHSLIALGLVLAGVFWAMVNINSYPMVVDLAGPGKTGAYTGMYYFSSQLAAILAPVLFGRAMDLFGNLIMFPMAFASLIIARVCFSQVRRGDAVPSSIKRGEAVPSS